MREELSKKYIRGNGIEIGGLHYPLYVEPGVEVTYIDRLPYEELVKENPTLKVVPNQIIVDNAEHIYSVTRESQDFVIANHVFEHCENAIQTIVNWFRVLKPGGIIYAAIPDKRHTFDKHRPITSFEHLQLDYELETHESRRMHYEEWFALAEVEDKKDQFQKVMNAMNSNQNIHFHVWDHNAIIQMFNHFKNYVPMDWFETHQHGAEVIVIARKKT